MKEIERKIFDIDPQEIEQKLLKFGAQKMFDGLLKVYFFDYPDNRISKRGDLLRVREFSGGKVEVTCKTNRRIEGENKVYDEFILEGDDLSEAIKFCECLGFQMTYKYEKRRKVFIMPNAEVAIDEYPKIPVLMEIEAHGEEDTDRIIDMLIEKLEITENESSTETINEYLKRKFPKIDLNNLTFN